MELSSLVIKGLQYLNDVPLDITKKIIANTIKLTLNPEATPLPEIYETESNKTKCCEYAIVSLLSLATRNSMSGSGLRKVLDDIEGISSSVIDEIIKSYDDNHKDLILHHLQLGFNFPHITDITWRIVADVKSSTSDKSSQEIGFYINLGRYDTDGERQTITEFLCNTEELQLLINKLKEIERHCEKISQE